MDLTNIAILDTETTGLDRERHEIWEVAYDIDGEETVMQFPVSITDADPTALRMNGFWDRYGDRGDGGEFDEQYYFEKAYKLAQDLRGKHIVGAVPSFDDNFLWKLLRRYGLIETWHYHLIDVEALATGYLLARGELDSRLVPWKSEWLSVKLGVDPADFERHSALGDVRWVKAQFLAMIEGARAPV